MKFKSVLENIFLELPAKYYSASFMVASNQIDNEIENIYSIYSISTEVLNNADFIYHRSSAN